MEAAALCSQLLVLLRQQEAADASLAADIAATAMHWGGGFRDDSWVQRCARNVVALF